MSKVELSREQIEKLFTFVKSKWVHYRDVQHEIVDHLASGIEVQLTHNPDLQFDKALQLEYQKFPVTGFVHFVQTKEKETLRYWRRKQLQIIKSYFQLPKVLILLALMSVVSFIIISCALDDSISFIITAGFKIFCVLSLLPMAISQWNKPKDILTINSYYTIIAGLHCGVTYFMVSPVAFFDQGATTMATWPLWLVGLYSLMISLYVIIIYASYYVFPKMLHQELKNKYAHLAIS